MRPGPVWERSAISPVAGPTRRAPRSRSTRTFSTVAGLPHIRSFMAGASSQREGSTASRVAVTTSSALPARSLASRSAVAGATTATSAQSASAMCPAANSCCASKRSVEAARPVSAWKVSAVTNRCAAGVSATRSSAPAFPHSRATSQDLYAAIPPPTQSSTRRPLKASTAA